MGRRKEGENDGRRTSGKDEGGERMKEKNLIFKNLAGLKQRIREGGKSDRRRKDGRKAVRKS